ncbi:MAG: hypothetical protein J6V44_05945 [Methanobrevibacter sp.]|nr:hypothetical protein [Methanobrevibacter sp.]MBO7692793.1 hypothetical protein [Methanobrevibacter sp.]
MKYLVKGSITFSVEADTESEAEEEAMRKMEEMLFTEFNLMWDQVSTEVIQKIDNDENK